MTLRSATWQLPLWHDGIRFDENASGAETDRLIASLWPHAYRIALSIVRDRGLAEDAAQEACAVVYREARRLRAPEAFGVWFYRIVVRRAMAIRKRESSFQKTFAIEEHASVSSDDELRMDVSRALAQLTPRQRAIVALRYYAQMSSREIGTILGIPDSTVRFHIMKSKALLEGLLAGHGGFCSGDKGERDED
jgi:RNA polymerase sigma-70 factor (ECF subfamily)